MVSPQQTITGELRKWRRKTRNDGKTFVIGKMYNDINEVWDDGDEAFILYDNWIESVNFYLAVNKMGAFKCPKDEEIPDAPKKFNGSDNPEKD